MQNTLGHHVLFLEHRLQVLNDQLTSPTPLGIDHQRLEAEIRVVQRALAHYQQAFDLEQLIGSSQTNVAQRQTNRPR